MEAVAPRPLQSRVPLGAAQGAVRRRPVPEPVPPMKEPRLITNAALRNQHNRPHPAEGRLLPRLLF